MQDKLIRFVLGDQLIRLPEKADPIGWASLDADGFAYVPLRRLLRIVAKNNAGKVEISFEDLQVTLECSEGWEMTLASRLSDDLLSPSEDQVDLYVGKYLTADRPLLTGIRL